MIGYITLWTNDFDRSVKFYDHLLWEMWATRFMESDTFIVWSTGPGTPWFSVTKPFNKQAATIWNGNMIALQADSIEDVKKFYNKAIELGWTDEGEPGPRGEGWFYAAYFRDLDGNKLSFFYFENK